MGNGAVCTPCLQACGPYFECPGGNTCGNCQPGYLNVNNVCQPYVPVVATVRSSAPDAKCQGTPIYGNSTDVIASLGGCDNCQTGPGNTSTVCGWSQGTPTYCCYASKYIWSAVNTTVTAYPFLSFPIVVSASDRSHLLWRPRQMATRG